MEMGEAVSLEGFKLTPEGEHMKTALGGTGDWLTPGGHRLKLEGICMAQPNQFPHDLNSPQMHMAIRDFWLRRLSPLI